MKSVTCKAIVVLPGNEVWTIAKHKGDRSLLILPTAQIVWNSHIQTLKKEVLEQGLLLEGAVETTITQTLCDKTTIWYKFPKATRIPKNPEVYPRPFVSPIEYMISLGDHNHVLRKFITN